MAAAASKGSAGRCAIFFYEGYLGVSPTNINLAKALAQAGYDVTIYMMATDSPDAGDLPGIRVVRVHPGRLTEMASRRISFATSLLYMLRSLFAEVQAAASGGGRTVYVGVDIKGGWAAALSSAVLRRRYVYVSLELRIPPEQKRGIRGALARLTYRRAAAVLAQGSDRFDLLAREFGERHPTTFTLPNSPFADATGTEPAGGGENLFRSKFELPPGKRIALQAGMINDITCSAALAAGFAGAGDWALVLHERFKRSPDEPYLAALRERNARNLYLSLDPVPYDQVDQVFASADVGLAFYQPETPDDDNYKFISSSGKLPHYFKFGKPVLVSDLPPLVEVVEAYGCGIVVKDPSNPNEVGAALDRIMSRYDEFSRNATRCFEERYDFGKGVEPVIRFLGDL